MVNILKQRELLCLDCGKYFLGKTAHYCPECANNRRRAGNKQRKSVLNDLDNRQSEINLVKYAIKLARAEKELKPEVCPHFDKNSMKCATCSEGSWKYKDCGRG